MEITPDTLDWMSGTTWKNMAFLWFASGPTEKLPNQFLFPLGVERKKSPAKLTFHKIWISRENSIKPSQEILMGRCPAPDRIPWQSPNDWGKKLREKRNSKWRSFFISSSFSFKRCSSHRNSSSVPKQALRNYPIRFSAPKCVKKRKSTFSP